MRPRFAKNTLERQRAQGRPGARCTRGLACKMHIAKTHTSIQVQRKHSGLPCAVVLTVTSCSPWRPGFLATIINGSLPADLTPASGCQDHTTSPSATCAVRLTHAVASTASRPALVTLANAPLCGTGCVKCAADLGSRSIPTRCDISTRRANQQLARDVAVKREIFLNRAGQTFGDLPVGQNPVALRTVIPRCAMAHPRARV
jgi:hypothetical protein